MRNRVIPLLAEYFFEDSEKIAAVLGDAASHDGPIKGGFLKRSVLKAPPGLEAFSGLGGDGARGVVGVIATPGCHDLRRFRCAMTCAGSAGRSVPKTTASITRG